MGKTIKSKLLSIVLIMIVVLVFVGVNTKVTSAAETVDASGITWSYEIDASGNAVDVKPADTTQMKIGGSISSVIIPDTLGGKKVTSIGASAFYSCTGLTSIIIPNSVTSIGTGAFCSCIRLKSLIIPSNVKSIGDRAFASCGFTSIIIPSSVISCGYSVFFQCNNLTNISIQNNTDSIVDSAFYECKSLSSIIIPDSVTRIGSYSFNGCTSLRSIIIPDSVTMISVSAFSGCTSLTSIIIPDGVTIIDKCTFNGCISLRSIRIPDSVKSIGESSFRDCTNLKNIIIPENVTSIGEGSFRDCTNLKNIIVPDSVTSIGEDSFKGCKNLESISIPDSVTSIGKGAFEGCTNLAKVYTNSDSYASKYDFVKGVVDNTAGYSAGSLIIELSNAKTDAKAKLAKVTLEIPQSLLKYTIAGGLKTDSVYMYVNSYKLGAEIEAETDPNKLIKWIAEIDDQITTLNTASKGLELANVKTNAKIKLAQANSSLSRYTVADGKSTESVYTELIKAIGGYTTDAEIEAETDKNKLISLVFEVDTKMNLLNIASENLELINAKTNAKISLDIYKDATAYREAQKTELVAAITTGKTNIDNAIVTVGVIKALENAKSTIDAIKTNSQLTVEELVTEKVNEQASKDKNNSEITNSGDVNALPLVVAAMIGMAGIVSFGKNKIAYYK